MGINIQCEIGIALTGVSHRKLHAFTRVRPAFAERKEQGRGGGRAVGEGERDLREVGQVCARTETMHGTKLVHFDGAHGAPKTAPASLCDNRSNFGRHCDRRREGRVQRMSGGRSEGDAKYGAIESSKAFGALRCAHGGVCAAASPGSARGPHGGEVLYTCETEEKFH